MPHHKLLHERDYLGHMDLEGKDFTLTITKVDVLQELTMQGGVKKRATIISFKEAQKKFILSAKINSSMIAKIHGDYSEDWPGKKITLHTGEYYDKMEKKNLPCIRVKDTSAKGVADKKKKDEAFKLNEN